MAAPQPPRLAQLLLICPCEPCGASPPDPAPIHPTNTYSSPTLPQALSWLWGTNETPVFRKLTLSQATTGICKQRKQL